MQTYTIQAKGDVNADAEKGERSSYEPETLEEIADRFGVDVDELFAANRDAIGSTPENTAIGMTLVIPDAAASSEADEAAEPEPSADAVVDDGYRPPEGGQG